MRKGILVCVKGVGSLVSAEGLELQEADRAPGVVLVNPPLLKIKNK